MGWQTESGCFLEFEFGSVAEGVQDAGGKQKLESRSQKLEVKAADRSENQNPHRSSRESSGMGRRCTPRKDGAAAQERRAQPRLAVPRKMKRDAASRN